MFEDLTCPTNTDDPLSRAEAYILLDTVFGEHCFLIERQPLVYGAAVSSRYTDTARVHNAQPLPCCAGCVQLSAVPLPLKRAIACVHFRLLEYGAAGVRMIFLYILCHG